MIQKLLSRNKQVANVPFEILRPLTFVYQRMPWSTKRIEHPEPPHVRKVAVLALQAAWTSARAEFSDVRCVPYPALTQNNLVIVHQYELSKAMAEHAPHTIRRIGQDLLALSRSADRQVRYVTANKQGTAIGKAVLTKVAVHQTDTGHMLTLEPDVALERRPQDDSFRPLQQQRRDSLQIISDLTNWDPGYSTGHDIGIPFAHLPESVPKELCENIAVDVQAALLQATLNRDDLSGFNLGATKLEYTE